MGILTAYLALQPEWCGHGQCLGLRLGRCSWLVCGEWQELCLHPPGLPGLCLLTCQLGLT